MSILLKNPEAEQMARELADLRGSTLTDAIKGALAKALVEEKRRRPTLDELREATRRLHEASGGLKPDLKPVTKEEWDELNALGYPEIDNA